MILQSLVEYYEQLCKNQPESIARLGWCPRKVLFLVDIDDNGSLIKIIPAEDKTGWNFFVPEQVKRSSGIKPNLLCDNSSYIFGIDRKGNPSRSIQCFEASRARHLDFLGAIDSKAAKAVFRFFETWNPHHALGQDAIVLAGKDLLAGGNLVFRYHKRLVLDDPSIREAWEREYFHTSDSDTVMRCLVTGENQPIAKLHPSIKGVVGAQSSGAALISFNANAFESYGHDGDQGFNAPVSEKAAFAYTTALNYLLTQPKHRIRLGDTTILYWAAEKDSELSACVNILCGGKTLTKKASEHGKPKENPDTKLNAVMKAIKRGHELNDDTMGVRFYVLGLAPNAARISVRFFLQSTFGTIIKNLMCHYDRLRIVHAPFEREYLTPYQLLRETENPNASKKDATSVLGGALMRAILTNSDYPEALYANVLLRIRVTQNDEDNHVRKITSGRVSIIKAYLLKNRHETEKEATVSLNKDRNDEPYVLGRLFAVLEEIQEAAYPDTHTTILNRYFDSANVTPAAIFPELIRASYHNLIIIKRDKVGLYKYFRKKLGNLTELLADFPKRLSSVQQGAFILGYQHQYESRFSGNKSSVDADMVKNGEE